jgi:hypothetical protein
MHLFVSASGHDTNKGFINNFKLYLLRIFYHLRHKTLSDKCINLKSLIEDNVIILILCPQIPFLALIPGRRIPFLKAR